MMKLRLVLLPVLLCGFLTCCERSDHDRERASHNRSTLTVKVEEGFDQKNPHADNICEGFPTDLSVARVSADGKPLASILYCAAYGYGHSSAEAFTDNVGRNYVLIRRDTVHASSYAKYELEVYRVLPDEYFKIMSMPIAIEAPNGPCPNLKYAYSVADSAAGGIELHLRREAECNGQPPKGIVPPDLERVIRIDVPK